MTGMGQRRALIIQPADAGPALSRYGAGLRDLLAPEYRADVAGARHFEPGRLGRFFSRRTPNLDGLAIDADLVHITDLYLVPHARRFQGARVVTVHDLMPRQFRRIRSRRSLTFAFVVERSLRMLRHADLVLTPSEFTRGQLVAAGLMPSQKVAVVPPSFPDTMRSAPEVPREAGLIVSVGPQLYYKNLDLLLHALAQPELRHARLVRVGRLSDASRATAHQLGVDRQIEETGFLSDEALIALYQRGTVLAQPSYCEGFGLPVAEAMLCGLPVVVSDGGALPEVVGTAGRIVPLRGRRPRQPVNRDDAKAFALALAEVLGDEALRRTMSEAGLREAERFTRVPVRAGLLAAYEKAKAHAQRRRRA